MASNISFKSRYIIFIISINIISVVCLYQPISQECISPERKHFMYADYLKMESTQNLKKLDIKKFYNSYFSPNYRMLPHNELESYGSLDTRINLYCRREYVSQIYFEKTHEIVAFGQIIIDLKNCLVESPSAFDLIKYCSLNSDDKNRFFICLEDMDRVEILPKVQQCLISFTSAALTVFSESPAMFDTSQDFKFTTGYVGEKTFKALSLASGMKTPEEINDNHFEQFTTLHEKFTGGITNLKKIFKDECAEGYKSFDENNYDKLIKKYYVFRGFKDLTEFTKQIKVTLKHFESIEGPLINNKELYDYYHANSISEENYNELRSYLPLIYEDSYLSYSIRLNLLGYIPLDEYTWKEQMEELRNPSPKNEESSSSSHSPSKPTFDSTIVTGTKSRIPDLPLWHLK